MKNYKMIAMFCTAVLFVGASALRAEEAAAPAAAEKAAAPAKEHKKHECEACKTLKDAVVLCEKCKAAGKAECDTDKAAVKAAKCEVCKAKADAKKKAAEEKKAAEAKVEEKK